MGIGGDEGRSEAGRVSLVSLPGLSSLCHVVTDSVGAEREVYGA